MPRPIMIMCEFKVKHKAELCFDFQLTYRFFHFKQKNHLPKYKSTQGTFRHKPGIANKRYKLK